MLVKPELYKGISFIRISSLPVTQIDKLREKAHRNLIIKILKDDELINDCISYGDYVTWYNEFVATLERNERLYESPARGVRVDEVQQNEVEQ